MSEEDKISQMIADVGNAILRYPRPTQRIELIKQFGYTYNVLKEKFKVEE